MSRPGEPAGDTPDGSRFAVRLALVAVAALALRLAVRIAVGTRSYWEDGYTQYRLLAANLAAGHGYAFPGGPPTAFRVPLYTLFIAATTGGSGNPWFLIAAQAVVSTGLVVLAGLIGRRLHGPAAGLVAAVWCAAYPYYVWHDTSLQESGLFAALAALATWLLMVARDKPRPLVSLGAGAALGLAILTRSTLAPFAVLALMWLLLPGRHVLRSRLASAALTGAALCLTLTPWLVRAHHLTGAYGLGTESGQSLYAGASPLLFSAFPEQSVDVSREAVFAAIPGPEAGDRDRFSRGNPARESEWYTRRAVRMAAADPAGYALRAARKLAIAFGPRPVPHHGLLADTAYALCWVPLLLLALMGLWLDRANRRLTALLIAHFAAFAGVTALVWAQTAHRAYLDVYLMILAAPVVLRWLPERVRRALSR